MPSRNNIKKELRYSSKPNAQKQTDDSHLITSLPRKGGPGGGVEPVAVNHPFASEH
jgi:hypothetical protein